MIFRGITVALLTLLLSACASWKTVGSSPPGAPVEYVEVPNPLFTQGKDPSPTVWVPAKAQGGIPRGGVLVQEGVQMAKEGFTGKESKPAATAAAPSSGTVAATAVSAPPAGTATAPVYVPVPSVSAARLAAPPVAVKKRIAIMESGQNGLIAPFSDQVKVLGVGVPVDLSVKGNLSSVAANENERPAFAGELWKDNVASVLVVVAATDGVGGGQSLVADIYDGIEKSRLSRVATVIPSPAGSDKVSKDASLSAALADLSLRVGDVVNLTPWYGRIFAVEGERVYLNAGRESGIQIGQKLKVYRGGKVITGIGFDPGTPVTTLEIAGFVGTNGSYGVVRDGQSVNLSDTVSFN